MIYQTGLIIEGASMVTKKKTKSNLNSNFDKQKLTHFLTEMKRSIARANTVKSEPAVWLKLFSLCKIFDNDYYDDFCGDYYVDFFNDLL